MTKPITSNKTNRDGRKPKPLTPQNNTTTLAVRCYDEQCLYGSIEETLKRIMMLDRNRYEAYAIAHNKTGKTHLHIALKYRGKKSNDSIRVSRILKDIGIRFRKEDAIIMQNRGLETLGSWTGYFVYLCHKDAVSESLGKITYEISDFVTNLEPGVFKNKMQGRLPKRKIMAKEQFSLDCDEAWQAGYDLWNRDRWMKTKRKDYVEYGEKKMNLIKDFFDEGRKERISSYLPQINIVIKISDNLSYDYYDIEQVTKKALADLNMSIAYANKDTVDAIICNPKRSDMVERVDTTDGKSIEVVKESYFLLPNKVLISSKQNSLIAWTYSIYIIDYLIDDQTIKDYEDKPYYYCIVSQHEKKLRCIDVCRRGSNEEEIKRKKLFVDFMTSFNIHLETYVHEPKEKDTSIQTIDYSDILSPADSIS